MIHGFFNFDFQKGLSQLQALVQRKRDPICSSLSARMNVSMGGSAAVPDKERRARMKAKRKKRSGYKKELCAAMLRYFSLPTEGAWDEIRERGLPSFLKFANSMGITLEELKGYREKHAEFRSAYSECEARLYDLLVDGVLMKRFDSTFARLLLQAREESVEEGDTQKSFALTLTVFAAFRTPTFPANEAASAAPRGSTVFCRNTMPTHFA